MKYNQDEIIYLWIIKDTDSNINYIHYVGETINFSKRQKEHLAHILGLNYYVIDANLVKQGVHKIVWNGMWGDKSKDADSKTLENYIGPIYILMKGEALCGYCDCCT